MKKQYNDGYGDDGYGDDGYGDDDYYGPRVPQSPAMNKLFPGIPGPHILYERPDYFQIMAPVFKGNEMDSLFMRLSTCRFNLSLYLSFFFYLSIPPSIP
jgi:hypothetical protein